ncbi:MAG: hypothetical protein KGJ35_00580 [Patescibacteria group bacterium]|nr:hypothetical protein [Patescibacteria group bacterium]
MIRDLMPQGYFDEVQKYMVRDGFTLISRVTIDKNECDYHVPCTKARDTSLFFHIRGKSVMVMLRYLEDDYWNKKVEGYWEIAFYFRFMSYRRLLEQNPHWLGQGMEDSLYHDMPILGSKELLIEGFRHQTGLGLTRDTEHEQIGLCFEEERGRQETVLNERILAFRVREAVKMVEKYLDSKPFYHISVMHFCPHYTFSGEGHHNQLVTEKLEKVFWSKFDWGYFRHLVDRPYGYNFHRKDQKVAT